MLDNMQDTTADDYAVAYGLNLLVMGLITLVYIHKNTSISDNLDVQEINRVYILLVDELQKLYASNPKLSELKPEPIWRRFEVIKFHIKEIQEHVAIPENGHGGAHFAKVERLCILSNANIEAPSYTPEQKKIVDNAHKILNDFEAAHEARKNNKANNWRIPEYTLTYDPIRGTIKINDVYQLNKRSTNDSSNIDKLLAKGMNQPNELFNPELITTKSLSSIISNAGFTPTIRKLFIPVARKGKGVLVRPIVSRTEADAEGIDTTELDLQLKELGAVTEPKN